MKQQKIMFGSEIITIIYSGLCATIDIYNRIKKSSCFIAIDEKGILHITGKLKPNTKGLYRALCEYDKHKAMA